MKQQSRKTTIPTTPTLPSFQNTLTLAPLSSIPLSFQQHKLPHPTTNLLSITNQEGITSKRINEWGGHFFCGRDPVTRNNAVQCYACQRVEQFVLSGTVTLNAEHVYSYFSKEKQHFYCLRNFSSMTCKADSNCTACAALDVLQQKGYIQIDETSGVICRYSFVSQHFYCSRAMFQKTILNDEFCGPLQGPQCKFCSQMEAKTKAAPVTLQEPTTTQPISPFSIPSPIQEIFHHITLQQQQWIQQQLQHWNSDVEIQLKDTLYAHMLEACEQQQLSCDDVLFDTLFEAWIRKQLPLRPRNSSFSPLSLPPIPYSQSLASEAMKNIKFAPRAKQQQKSNSVVYQEAQKVFPSPPTQLSYQPFPSPPTQTMQNDPFDFVSFSNPLNSSNLITFEEESSTTQPVQRQQAIIEPTAPPKEEEDNDCSICMERQCNAALVPCGHLKFCYECGDHLVKANKECPYCRQPVTMCMKIYK